MKACSIIRSINKGHEIYAEVSKRGWENDVCISSALVDLNAKCGLFAEAQNVFGRLPVREIVSWNALIAGCAQQSDYSLAFQLFQDNMLQLRLETNVVTFLCLILAGSRGGLLYDGLLHLNSMQGHHHITPMLEHYNLLVDLLGQKGYLNEAEDLLETIPFQHNAIGWTLLLSSCKNHVDLNVARQCFDR